MSTLECVHTLSQWAVGSGSLKHVDVDFGYFEGFGYGGVLKKSVCSGEILLSIPLSISIDPFVSKRGSSFELSTTRFPFSKEEESNNFNLDIIHMYLFLVKERRNGKSSFYHPYVNSLPSSFPSFPISHYRFETKDSEFPKRDEISKGMDCPDFVIETDPNLDEALGGTNLLRSLNNMFTKLVKLFFYITRHEDEFLKSVKFEELLWAFIIVWSRAFPIYENEDTKSNPTPTLLPFIDVLNHEPYSKREFVVDHEKKTFTLKTMEDIVVENESEGCQRVQLFNNYGVKGNDSFLQSYGFVLDDNPDDTFFLQLGTQLHRSQTSAHQTQDNGVYLKRPSVDVSPLHRLLKNTQKLIDKRKEFSRPYEEEDVDELNLGNISLECLATLKELLFNKVSGFDSEKGRSSSSDTSEEKGDLLRMCFVYKASQRRILEESIGKIEEYMTRKQEIVSESPGFLMKAVQLTEKTDYSPNFKIFEPHELHRDLISCPPNQLTFLNELKDEEIKLAVYLFLLLCGYEKLPQNKKSFFDEVERISSTNTPLLLLYERKKEELERYLSVLDIVDQLAGIRDELYHIFNTLTSKDLKYFDHLEKMLSECENRRKFDFQSFLYCYTIVERFSVRSFRHVYIIPCCGLYKPFGFMNRNPSSISFTNVFRCFDEKKRVLRLYHALDPKIENADTPFQYLLYQSEDSTFDEYFRKYNVMNPNLPNRYPLQISLQQQQQGFGLPPKVFLIYLDGENKPVHLKNLLEQIYNFGENKEGVYGLMENLVGQVLGQLLGSCGGDVDEDFAFLTDFVGTKISVLQKNLEWMRKKDF